MSIENAINQLKTLMEDRLTISISERKHGQTKRITRGASDDLPIQKMKTKYLKFAMCNDSNCPIIPGQA